MNKQYSVRLGGICLTLLALAAVVPTASAAVIGTLNVAQCGGSSVTVTANTISWLPIGGVGVAGTSGCVQVGQNAVGSPYVTFTGGSIAQGEQGTIKDLTFGVTSGTNFMVFSGVGGGVGTISFTLAPFAATGLGACTTGMAIGSSCTPGGVGPFILTASGPATTTVTLLASGTVSDGSLPVSNWTGTYSTQFNLAPIDIQNFITGVADSNTGLGCVSGSCTNSYSGTFAITVGVPEPASMLLIGAGLIGLASWRKRKYPVA